jgi:signal transduction histidine kinase
MPILTPTLLLIKPDNSEASAVCQIVEQLRTACCITTVPSFSAARIALEDFSPDLMILHAWSPHSASAQRPAHQTSLADVVSTLVSFAPVVVLGHGCPPSSLATLLASGAADFVDLAGSNFSEAVLCIEKRLQRAPAPPIPLARPELFANANAIFAGPFDEHFGELLRHELNNPLTGILGNAELLLAETRRQSGRQPSDSAIRRLETIAALAVRMRETVRRLSRSCEEKSQRTHSA